MFEFRVASTSCLAKAEEIRLSNYLPIAGGGNNWSHTFPKGIIYIYLPIHEWIYMDISFVHE